MTEYAQKMHNVKNQSFGAGQKASWLLDLVPHVLLDDNMHKIYLPTENRS